MNTKKPSGFKLEPIVEIEYDSFSEVVKDKEYVELLYEYNPFKLITKNDLDVLLDTDYFKKNSNISWQYHLYIKRHTIGGILKGTRTISAVKDNKAQLAYIPKYGVVVENTCSEKYNPSCLQKIKLK